VAEFRGRVSFFQQPHNVGHVANFNVCLQRARGHLIHILHGDDAVREGFYDRMQQVFVEHPELGAAFCRIITMDEHSHWQKISPIEQQKSGILEGWLEKIAIGQRLQTPSVVVRREVYEHLGGFDRRLAWTEDWEMWVRIAAYYPVWYEVEPLAIYRVHSSSSSGRLRRTGEDIQDVRRAIEINKSYLPPERVKDLSNTAKKECALAAIRRARRAIDIGNQQTFLSQTREALKTHFSLPVLTRAVFLLPFWLRNYIRTKEGRGV
jgi:GT2 family glycosyltransferase